VLWEIPLFYHKQHHENVSILLGHLYRAAADFPQNWIHGTDDNPILDLAKATKTAMHTWAERTNFFDEHGKLLKDGREMSDVMWKIIVQAFKYSAQHTSTIDPNESLNDFLEKKVEEEFSGEEASRKKKVLMQVGLPRAQISSSKCVASCLYSRHVSRVNDP
jgi:hypothetical protein